MKKSATRTQTSDLRPAPRGFVALITVLVVMVVLLTIGGVISAVGQDQVSLALVYNDGEQAFAIADACAEEGSQRLKLDNSFTGTTFSLDGGTCTLTVTNTGGNNRQIIGTGTYFNATRIVQVDVTIASNTQGNAQKVKINSWKEAP